MVQLLNRRRAAWVCQSGSARPDCARSTRILSPPAQIKVQARMTSMLGIESSCFNKNHFVGPLPTYSVQPTEHFLVPQQRIVRLQDPVILIGKIDESRRHAFLPERVEVGEALRDRHAKVFLAVQDEGRSLEVRREPLGGLLVDD